MLNLVYLFHRLCRCPRTRGFGMQSPSAYRLMREVVKNNHTPQVYATAEQAHLCNGRFKRFGRLLYRLCHEGGWLTWQVQHAALDALRPYIIAGGGRLVPENEGVALLCAVHEFERIAHFMESANEHSLLVVTGIRESKQLWRNLTADSNTGVAFDLYDCGLVFFDKKKYKQLFRVNY